MIDEKLWTYKQNSFLPHLSEDEEIHDEYRYSNLSFNKK